MIACASPSNLTELANITGELNAVVAESPAVMVSTAMVGLESIFTTAKPLDRAIDRP